MQGVRRWAGDDLIALQAEAFKVLDDFFSQFGSIIISGCEVSGDDIAPGIVGLYGRDPDNNITFKVVPFSGRVGGGDVFPVYLTLSHTVITRDYGDNEIKPIAYDYAASLSNELPEGVNYIRIDRTGNRRFMDNSLPEIYRVRLEKLGGIETYTEEQSVKGLIASLIRYTPTYIDHEPGENDSNYPVGALVLTISEEGERSFWRCYDNTEEAAVWSQADGGGVSDGGGGSNGDALKEKANITLTGNQSLGDIIGAKFDIVIEEQTTEYTFEGTTATILIAPGQPYQIVPKAVSGYKTPAAKSYTAVMSNSRDIQFLYLAEKLTINVSANDAGSVSGQTLSVTNVGTSAVLYSGVAAAGVQVLIPYDVNYKVSVNAKAGYLPPADFTATANMTARTATLQYEKIVSADIIFAKNVSSISNITGSVNQGIIADILSMMRSCLCKKTGEGQVAIRYLKNSDRNYYDDSTAAVLTGSEGDVMVYIPAFYYKFSNVDTNNRKLSFALTQPDSTWKLSPAGLCGAYKAYVSSNKVYSRSGVTPTASLSQTNFINYATARGSGYNVIDYEMHCAIAFLFYAKYGNRSSQDVLGVGGLSYGSGSTGTTNGIGNADTVKTTSGAVNFQGIEAVHGWYYEWVSGVTINNRVWTIQQVEGGQRTVNAGTSDGWITDLAAMGTSDFLDVIPTAVGGSETTYFADYYYQSSSTGLALLRSSHSSYTNGGVSLTNASNAPSDASSVFGSRLAFRGVIVEAASVAAFKALPVL
ncbi:hypothetical protein EZS27_004480 [termite gut metagenome]|uniref:Uncharacterized protein n=1 Tax=termite gut metagenome TaxID=433724 RepID=A0A5J4SQ41_9ZZZZ